MTISNIDVPLLLNALNEFKKALLNIQLIPRLRAYTH